MADTAIEWTDKVWNPIRGCSLVSAGCSNCYAMRQAHRFSGPGQPYTGLTRLTRSGPVWNGRVAFIEPVLNDPLAWRKPCRVFVNSMSDLFHEHVTDDQIDQVFATMQACPQHVFQVLTKRPARMLAWSTGGAEERVRLAGEALASKFDWCHAHEDRPWPLDNVWLGVSVENQATADQRIPLLLETPAAVRFVSAEPLLDQVDLDRYLDIDENLDRDAGGEWRDGALSWVIVGGESGPGARPCCLSWVRNIVHDCQHAGVPLFVKQLGARPFEASDDAPLDDGTWPAQSWLHFDDRKGGDPSEWTEYLRVRQFPGVSRG